MGEPRRPIIVIPARFSDGASALRYRAVVAARALVEAVFAAGGEPLLMHPHAPAGRVDDDVVRARLAIADGVLLPGGGDLDPRWSGQADHPTQYDVDVEQDGFDLAVARVALADGIPLLAICRGTQVVNVLRGGDIVQDMDSGSGNHRHRTHTVSVSGGSVLAAAVGSSVEVSCYHHQCLGRLGSGIEVVGRSKDEVIEAVQLNDGPGWFLGTQWHPEDTAGSDPQQAALFSQLISAARRYGFEDRPRRVSRRC